MPIYRTSLICGRGPAFNLVSRLRDFAGRSTKRSWFSVGRRRNHEAAADPTGKAFAVRHRVPVRRLHSPGELDGGCPRAERIVPFRSTAAICNVRSTSTPAARFVQTAAMTGGRRKGGTCPKAIDTVAS